MSLAAAVFLFRSTGGNACTYSFAVVGWLPSHPYSPTAAGLVNPSAPC